MFFGSRVIKQPVLISESVSIARNLDSWHVHSLVTHGQSLQRAYKVEPASKRSANKTDKVNANVLNAAAPCKCPVRYSGAACVPQVGPVRRTGLENVEIAWYRINQSVFYQGGLSPEFWNGLNRTRLSRVHCSTIHLLLINGQCRMRHICGEWFPSQGTI
jgi:hypothetical protein